MKRYVMCYDIADDRRRRRIARILDGVGDRVQESVFEADLDAALLDKVKTRLDACLNAEEDAVAVYPLCRACARGRMQLGRASTAPSPWGEDVVIVI